MVKLVKKKTSFLQLGDQEDGCIQVAKHLLQKGRTSDIMNLNEVSRQELLNTVQTMTERFPYRLAGSPCEAEASRYVTERLRSYGLEAENKEFYAYNSDPMYSKVVVLDPEMEIDSLPCAHIRATKPEGEVFDIVYVGNGDAAA